MKKYARLWPLMLLAVLAAVLWPLAQRQFADVQVRFDQTESIPGYQFRNSDPPLRIAMISVLNHEATAKDQKQLAESIGRLLHRPVLVMQRKSYAEINQLLTKGDADLGLLSTGAYCAYKSREDFTLLAMQERNQLPYYYGYVVVRDSRGYDSLEDLRGRRFAYVDPLSYSGYLGLQEQLVQQGEKPEQFFHSFYFIYSHDASLRAVQNDFVDGAVVDSLAYDYLKKHEPELAAQLRILLVLPPRGTSPVVARRGLTDLDRIQQVLLRLHEDPEARTAMEHLMIDRFIPPQPELYPPIEWREREGG